MESIEKKLKKIEIDLYNLKLNFSKILSILDKNFNKEIILSLLKERGLKPVESDEMKLILPKDERFYDEYFELLGSYYFRRVLSDMIKKKEFDESFVDKLKEKWGEKAVKKYLPYIMKYEIIIKKYNKYISNYYNIDNFGDTLEWYIVKILLNEFSIPSISNVKIKGLSTGGDFDIFFLLLGKLSYLEIKSSPPNNISIEEIENFIKRVDIINPSVSILFIDTTLNIKRNIIDNMKFLLKRVNREFSEKVIRNGFYKVSKGIYVFNSKRSFKISFNYVLDDLIKEERY
ncbi:MAG TPA: hypothetical protein PLW61_00300 [Caldisericia bacterium]|nr:hypothetical protein [Caldisericia bacterium]HPB33195.1 hypothetical protein [Caldisericia bacterium]HQL66715.1 hypothetical protein [Caldisericia bacterium]HQN47969.1 hypothetical protein [Caldisericia bacterium]HQO99053.1 hypothetical protein [Caldisericia bacterium]